MNTQDANDLLWEKTKNGFDLRVFLFETVAFLSDSTVTIAYIIVFNKTKNVIKQDPCSSIVRLLHIIVIVTSVNATVIPSVVLFIFSILQILTKLNIFLFLAVTFLVSSLAIKYVLNALVESNFFVLVFLLLGLQRTVFLFADAKYRTYVTGQNLKLAVFALFAMEIFLIAIDKRCTPCALKDFIEGGQNCSFVNPETSQIVPFSTVAKIFISARLVYVVLGIITVVTNLLGLWRRSSYLVIETEPTINTSAEIFILIHLSSAFLIFSVKYAVAVVKLMKPNFVNETSTFPVKSFLCEESVTLSYVFPVLHLLLNLIKYLASRKRLSVVHPIA